MIWIAVLVSIVLVLDDDAAVAVAAAVVVEALEKLLGLRVRLLHLPIRSWLLFKFLLVELLLLLF